MTLVQPKAGFHTGGGGGNLTGIVSDYIIPVLAAGKNITVVAADTAAGLYDAAVACQNYQNTTSVLCYRTTDQRSIGGFDFDALANNFAISPEENAALHWAAFEPTIPPELLPYKSSLELIILNEIRGKQTGEPVYQGLHIGEYLGRFALAYRALTDWRLLFFGFASGEPDPDVWEQPSMLDLLRVCGERPYDTGIALHEYSYNVNDILDGYPYKVGRFMFLFNVCEQHGIPWPRVVISEWGWTLDNVPDPAKAIDDIDGFFGYEYGPFEQIAGAAIWWLGPGFGNIADKAQKLIKPLGDYIVATDYNVELEQQPTPPDGGGGTVKIKTDEQHIVSMRGFGGRVTKKLRMSVLHNNGTANVNTGWKDIDISEWADLDIRGFDFHAVLEREIEIDCPTEPTDPNPPPVSNPLPQGALIVDVSYSNDVNLATLKTNGVQGVIIRASNGIRLTGSSNALGVDVRFWQHLEEATQLSMPWGSYHYCNENYDDVAQVQHFLGIIETAVNEGYPLPSLGLWLDFETPSNPAYAGAPISEARIQELCTALANLRPSAVADYGVYTSKGWWDAKVPNAAAWVPPLGLKAWAAAWVASGTLVNGWPPSWWHPSNLKGFTAVHFWQWTSSGGFEVGHSVDSLDLNYVGNTAVPPTTEPDPPTPPAGQTYDTSFMRAEPGIWRVIRRGDGSSEDVWELPLDAQNDVRVKNTQEGEWYFYGLGGVWRKRDTSPAPDPVTGQARLYMFTEGGQIAPNEAQVGVTYYYPNVVQFKAKATCQNLSTNSGPSTSTFLLKEVIQNYTFPGTGVTVDWLYVTVQTGETQLYAMKDGRTLGWVGGGAQQSNNVWAGQLAEVHYDRQIPQQEPERYC